MGDLLEASAAAANKTNATQPAPAAGANIASPVCMFVTGLLGNAFALVVLHRTKTEIRRTLFYTLVAGLAWTDLLGIVLTSPVTIAIYINNLRWLGGQQLCKFNGLIMVCFGLSTPFIICTMAVERFLALKCTFFYSTRCKKDTARLTIVALWSLVVLFSILPLLGFGEFSLQYPGTWCFLNFRTSDPVKSAYGYLYAGLNLLIIAIMLVCNVFVIVTLFRVWLRKRRENSGGRRVALTPSSTGEERNLRRKKTQQDMEMQMIWLMCALTTIFIVCWAPLMVQIIVTLVTKEKNYLVDLLCVRLASVNQLLDPWLYILMRKAFLQKITSICRRLFRVSSWSPCHSKECRRHENRFSSRLFRSPLPIARVNFVAHSQVDSEGERYEPQCQERPLVDVDLPSPLPDVMLDTESRHSPVLPDLTLAADRMGNPRKFFPISTHEFGLLDSDPDGIYVSIFLLARPQAPNSTGPSWENSRISQRPDNDSSSANIPEGSLTSGIYSSNSLFYLNSPELTDSEPSADGDVTREKAV